MSGWARECESCDELHYEAEMEEIDGDYYCSSCYEEKKEEDELQADPSKRKKFCVFCSKRELEKDFIEKLEGVMCQKCAHNREVEIAGFDDTKCSICDHKAVGA
jgi:hypothetical protein